MRIRCIYDDGNIVFTNINCSLSEAKDYYVGNYFNFGVEHDIMKKCILVEEDKTSINGCDFCNDLRNIEPAKYIGGEATENNEWWETAKKENAMVMEIDGSFIKIKYCPLCSKELNADEYE